MLIKLVKLYVHQLLKMCKFLCHDLLRMYELTFFDSSNELALEGASKLSIVLDVLYRQIATIMKLQLCNTYVCMYTYHYVTIYKPLQLLVGFQ